MCRAVKCRVCGKTTWAGCGRHVDEVRRGVKPSDWCPGHEQQQKRAAAGFFSRLLGGSAGPGR